MSLELALNVVLGITPVPGLAPAFTVFKFIVSCVKENQDSKKQLVVLANALGQLLGALHREFQSSRLIAASCVQPLRDLMSLLEDIHRFVQTEQDRSFLKSLFHAESRVAAIELFYHRIRTTTSTFQISAQLSIQRMLQDNERARLEDVHALNERFSVLEHSHRKLRRALDINHRNVLAMMVSIERRIEENRGASNPEQNFYSHALQYLTTTSGQQVKLEDWMISPFDVDYGPEIGSGGFGTVFRGTWNRTEVAIKVIHNASGVAANIGLLRKEIDIWMTLRHPNILQFLGANTLDDRPFVVMPLMPFNSREFLRTRPSFDPLSILRDISLGLEYLHARKICHGDLKGINVLVEDSGRALLCDFGLARIKADITSRTRTTGDSAIPGSRNWMAPELLSGSLPRPSSDVYAFGMTLYELYTDEIPLSSIPYGDFIELVFRIGVRPERPDEDACPRINDGVWNLAERCWNKDAKARPTARQIHDTIKMLITPPQPRHQAGSHGRRHTPPPALRVARGTGGGGGGKKGNNQQHQQHQQKGDKKSGGKGAQAPQQAWQSWGMDNHPQAATDAWGSKGDKKGGGKGAQVPQQAWQSWGMDNRPQAAADAWGSNNAAAGWGGAGGRRGAGNDADSGWPPDANDWGPAIYTHPPQMGPNGMIYSHSAPVPSSHYPQKYPAPYPSMIASSAHMSSVNEEHRRTPNRRNRSRSRNGTARPSSPASSTSSLTSKGSGSTYYVMPTGRQRVHVIHTPDKSASLPTASSTSHSPTSPNSMKKQPFFQRVLGFAERRLFSSSGDSSRGN